MREKVELDAIPGMVFCPRCKSRTLSDPKSNVVMCDNIQCGFPFCKTCQQTWHGPGPCAVLDKVTGIRRGGGALLIQFQSSPKRNLSEWCSKYGTAAFVIRLTTSKEISNWLPSECFFFASPEWLNLASLTLF